MPNHAPTGPRRTESVDAYLRGTRALALVAVLLLVGGVVSDVLEENFWDHHALLAGLASDLIVVMLTIALVNEAVERRSRERWSVLAQYVMLQLVRDARLVWTGIAELADLMSSDPYGATADVFTAKRSIDEGSSAVQDTKRLTAALQEIVADDDKRKRLHEKITTFIAHNDTVLGRWAAVMLNSDLYAELIDRHVELAGDLAWLSGLLGFERSGDDRDTRSKRSHPAPLIEGSLDDEQLAQRLAAITQLAEQLDRGTLALAQRIVPIDWWREQLGANDPVPAPLD